MDEGVERPQPPVVGSSVSPAVWRWQTGVCHSRSGSPSEQASRGPESRVRWQQRSLKSPWLCGMLLFRGSWGHPSGDQGEPFADSACAVLPTRLFGRGLQGSERGSLFS